MRRLALTLLLAALPVSPALAEVSLWRCDVGPVPRGSNLFSGVLLIAFDDQTGQAWVQDPGVRGLEKDFVPAKRTVKGNAVTLRWKVRFPVEDSHEIARFSYVAGFDPAGKRISVSGSVQDNTVTPSGPRLRGGLVMSDPLKVKGPRAVSGTCARAKG